MKTWLEYVFFMMMRAVARSVPFHAAGRMGAVLGGLVFRWTPVRKRVTLANLAHAFPEKSAEERRQIALEAFRNYGCAIFEFLALGGATDEELQSRIRWRDPDLPRQAYARGKGLIMLSAHFGGWEMILPAFRLNFPWPVMAIVQQQRNRRIDALVDRQRRRFVTSTVSMARAVREVLLGLKARKVLILLGDQSGSRESLFIPFFGRPTATHRGAAAFALKSGAPIVMFLPFRQPDGRYEIACEEVEFADISSYTEEHIIELSRRHTALLERYIRTRPGHWLWLHKRWKHTSWHQDQGAVPSREGVAS